MTETPIFDEVFESTYNPQPDPVVDQPRRLWRNGWLWVSATAFVLIAGYVAAVIWSEVVR